MYRIGEFSKMAKISVKTLHFYDEIGIFTPQHVNKETGYRYYASDQLLKLYRIISLRDSGFSINEIMGILDNKDYFDNSRQLEIIMKQKQSELKGKIQDLQRKLTQIETYINDLVKENKDMEYSVVVKEIPETIVASIRTMLYDYSSFNDIIEKIKSYIKELNINPSISDYCFTIYYDGEYKDNNMDAEICQVVSRCGKDSADIIFKTIPQVPIAACILHKGSYKSISRAYSVLIKWIIENGYEIVGALRECYIDGFISNNNYDNLVTEIQAPIIKKGKG